MAVELSPGAAIWYEEAKIVRKEQQEQNPGYLGEWSLLFREINMARMATVRTWERGGLEQVQFEEVMHGLVTGHALLDIAFEQHGEESSPQHVDDVTSTPQTVAYHPLHHFLHPETASNIRV